ncbi:MAG: hypothetical protein AAGJ35_00600 [Myxococcota bacterium]
MKPLDMEELFAELEQAASSRGVLNLSSYGLGEEGAIAIASAKHLSDVRVLYLQDNQVGSRGVAALLGSKYLGYLKALDLGENVIGDEGVFVLAEAEALHRLEELELWYNGISARGVIAIATSKYLRSLRILRLELNDLSFEALLSLSESAYLANLMEVHWGEEEIEVIKVSVQATTPWECKAPLHHRTRRLAQMCRETPDLGLLPRLLTLLDEEPREGALSLWTLRVLEAWDVGEHGLEVLEDRVYEGKAWEQLRLKLVARGREKREVLWKEGRRLEEGLFE